MKIPPDMPSANQAGVDKSQLVADLAEGIGCENRQGLERLPLEELYFLATRPDLQERYGSGKRGTWLFEWEMSAVERGECALAEIDAFGALDWTNTRTLDVGCGEGGFLIAMARRAAQAHGVDLSEGNVIATYMRGRAWALPVAAALATADALPYPDGAFDVVTSSEVIEHLAKPVDSLREIARVLRPGGFFHLSAPTRFSLGHLWRDPHYGYFGVAALPPRLAEWYLARVRRAFASREEYGVERLPTLGATTAALRRLGFEVIAGEYPRLAKLRDTSRVRKHWKGRLLSVLLAIGLRRPLAAVFGLAAEMTWPLRLVCRKSPGTKKGLC